MHLSGVVPVQESHPLGHFVMAAVSKKYFGEAIKQSAKALPKQTAQLVKQAVMAEIAVELDKVTVEGKYFPHPSFGKQSNKVADLHEIQLSML